LFWLEVLAFIAKVHATCKILLVIASKHYNRAYRLELKPSISLKDKKSLIVIL
jgi:hypothetical protein